MSCTAVCSSVACNSVKHVQPHHISYDPEIIVPLCKKCHTKLHKHGTGGLQTKPRGRFVFVGVKFPAGLAWMMEQYKKLMGYATVSELIRAAITGCIRKDTPFLFHELYQRKNIEENPILSIMKEPAS